MTRAFQGIFAALTTPFEGEDVSLAGFEANIRRFNAFGLAGYVVLGSTAENVLLSDEESLALVMTARQSAAAGRQIIVGTARESTARTINFTRRAAALGVDAALVRTPGYYRSRMDSEALTRHYRAVAEASPVPVIIYNIPQNTGVSIESAAVVELSRHPNIAGIKDSSGVMAMVSEVVSSADAGFNFLVGAGSIVLPGLVMGASGAILAMANAAPELCVKLHQLFLENRLEEARALQERLLPLNKAVVSTYGIAGLKYALDLQGYAGGLPRLPLLPVSDTGKAEIRAVLEALGLVPRKN